MPAPVSVFTPTSSNRPIYDNFTPPVAVFKAPISIQAHRVVEEYIELTFSYESVHSPELGNPPHLRRQVSLPYHYSEGRVHLPTPEMIEYWNARRARQDPTS